MNSDGQSFALFYDPTVHVLVVWQITSLHRKGISLALRMLTGMRLIQRDGLTCVSPFLAKLNV